MIKNYILYSFIFGFTSLVFAQQKTIRVYTKRNKEDKSVKFYYEKTKPGSYYLNIKFSDKENTYTSDYNGVVKHQSGLLFKMKPIDPSESITYTYSYNWIRGVPNPDVDSTFVYTLPFKKGNKLYVRAQGYAKETYFGTLRPKSWKAYSFATKTTDTVCSVRKGIVIDVVNTFKKDTLKKEFTTQKNRIVIEHKDGTIAIYKGFVKDSFLVKLGDIVYPQTPLGLMPKSKNDTHYISLMISYLINNDFEELKNRSFTKGKSASKFLTPFFYSPEGTYQLKENIEYIVQIAPSILTKEFTKKELKQWTRLNEFN